jgi:aminopeptidase-like protein
MIIDAWKAPDAWALGRACVLNKKWPAGAMFAIHQALFDIDYAVGIQKLVQLSADRGFAERIDEKLDTVSTRASSDPFLGGGLP